MCSNILHLSRRSLNERILNTYRFVDTIIEDSGVDVDNLMNTTSSILKDGSIPWGKFNIGLSDIINYNIGNKFYLGLGLSTNERLSKYLKAGGYFGYWFGPKHANYGANIEIKFNRKQDFGFKLSIDHIYQAFGNYGFLNNAYNPLNESNYKYFYIKWTTLNTTASAELSTRFSKVLRGYVKFSLSDKQWSDATHRLSALDFKLRIAPGERYMLTPKGLVTVQPGKPVIWLSYQKGLKDVLDCPYNFDKLQAQLTYSFLTRYIGKTTITLQAGYIFGDVPAFENFNIFANNHGFALYSTESFATMQINEFICDKFALLFFTHNFGKFFKTKHFSPDFIFATNVGWGNPGMLDGFYESGLVIDNMLKLSGAKIGFGVFYRYGANSFDNVADNFAYKLKLAISF